MATFASVMLLQAAALICFILSCNLANFVDAQNAWDVIEWTEAHITFYGDESGSATMGGACGYGNLWATGYGLNTAALSTTLFNNALSCGACFEIKCNFTDGFSAQWCYPDAGSVIVTATNFCPPNWDRPTNDGGWCNPPRTHFDLPMAMFERLAAPVAGIIPVSYRRVPCVKTGGIKFYLGGNPWFNLVLVYNVGGPGDVYSVQMQGSNSPWYSMQQNWGQNWQLSQKLTGQCLSFNVTVSTGDARIVENLTSEYWSFGQTYEASTNF